jgi:hypothetical protein
MTLAPNGACPALPATPRAWRLWAMAALLACCGAAQAKTLRVPMPDAPPKVDGELTEPCWRSAAVADGFLLEHTAAPPTQLTTAYLLCDGKWLYVGVRCAETDLAGMRMKATPNEGIVWSDDFVEVHLDVTNGKRRFEQFAINPAGVKTDESVVRHARIAAARGDKEWRIEIALDLNDLGVRHLGGPVKWAINLGRVRHNGARDEETSVWSGAPGSADQASLMGEIIVGPPGAMQVDGLEVGDARWGAGNELSLRLTNRGDPQAVTISAIPLREVPQASRPGGAAAKGRRAATDAEIEQRATTLVASGEGRAAAGLYAITSLEPQQRLAITVTDASGEMLYRVWRPVTIAPLLSLTPLRPCYRGLILPGVEQCQFRASLGLTRAALGVTLLETQIRAAPWLSPTRLMSRLPSQKDRVGETPAAPLPRAAEVMYASFTPQSRDNTITIPTRSLPYGDLVVRVRCVMVDGRELAEASMPLRRLTDEQAAAVPAYVDEHNRLIVGGEPFFPLGWYGGHNMQHLAEIADSPFNCILDYGINGLALDDLRRYLDAAHGRGLKLIYCMNDLYPAATYHRQIGSWRGNQQMAEGIVSTFKDHPAVLAWYLNDELPREMIPDLMRYYDLVRATDPGHPTFIVHFVGDLLADFAPTTDVLGIDVYPVPTRPLTRVSEIADVGQAATQGRKPVWMVLQAFAWYQYATPEDPHATGGRGRIPTAGELQRGRAPTREEERCMTYLALTHGAMGLIFYCYYDLRVLPQYQEMWSWMKEIGAEVKELSPALLSPARLPVEVRGDAAKIHALLKEHDGKWYLLTVNGEPTPAKAHFVLPRDVVSLRVMFEARQAAAPAAASPEGDGSDAESASPPPTTSPATALRANGRVVSDDFAPYAAHVYEIVPTSAK